MIHLPRSRPFRPQVVPCALALGLAAFGCAADPGPPVDERAAAAARAAVPDTTPPVFPDAAPGALQIPDPVRLAMRRPVESWALAWRLALPTLRLDQFARTGVTSFAAEEASAYDGSVEGADLRLLHVVVPSPDVLLVLDPYLDLDLVADGDLVRAARGEEPGFVLVDLRRKTERKLLALPAGSRVDGAHWIDATRVVALADEPARGGRRPALYLIDVAAETVTRYAGPPAGADEGRAARRELDRRFRAARPEIVFD